MDVHRHSAMNRSPLKSYQRQRWHGPVGLLSLIGLLGRLGWGAAPPQAPASSPHATPLARYGQLPLSFEANQGQTDGQVQFLARGQGYTLF